MTMNKEKPVRLTTRDTLGNAYCSYCNDPCAVDEHCPEECVILRIDRLADYEDIGLSPEEIAEILDVLKQLTNRRNEK